MSLRVRVADGTLNQELEERESPSTSKEGLKRTGLSPTFKSTSAGALPGYDSAEIVYAVVDASRGAS